MNLKINDEQLHEGDRGVVELQSTVNSLEKNISQVVLGKPHVVRMCLVSLLAGEHILLEDVPGVGKTLIGKAVSKSVSGDFCRLQFTPDLLPSDILGSNIYNSKTSEFIFNPGPIFNNLVLADEINRAPPRTQSALLEAMSDNQVSVDGHTYELPKPFMVVATQNPFEFEGTYILPESQLDRFLLRISVGYPERQFERDVLTSHRSGEPVDHLDAVVETTAIVELQERVRQVKVDETIAEYILSIVDKTRNSEELNVGVSTRGALLWYRASQALALIQGREFVTPDDVKELTIPVLSHRIMAAGFVQGSHRQVVEAIINRIVTEMPMPS